LRLRTRCFDIKFVALRRSLHGRVRLTNNDRWFLVQMYRWFPAILKVVTIVQPETLVRWHRSSFRRYWSWKSNSRGGRPRIDMELRVLIRRMRGMPLLLRARVAWAHDWVSNPSLTATFETLPGASFIVNGAGVPNDSALMTVGATLQVNKNLSVDAKFDGQFANSSQIYAGTGTGTVRYAW
jgi:hypothetical protein